MLYEILKCNSWAVFTFANTRWFKTYHSVHNFLKCVYLQSTGCYFVPNDFSTFHWDIGILIDSLLGEIYNKSAQKWCQRQKLLASIKNLLASIPQHIPLQIENFDWNNRKKIYMSRGTVSKTDENCSVSQLISQLVNQSIRRSNNQPVSQSVNWLVSCS